MSNPSIREAGNVATEAPPHQIKINPKTTADERGDTYGGFKFPEGPLRSHLHRSLDLRGRCGPKRRPSGWLRLTFEGVVRCRGGRERLVIGHQCRCYHSFRSADNGLLRSLIGRQTIVYISLGEKGWDLQRQYQDAPQHAAYLALNRHVPILLLPCLHQSCLHQSRQRSSAEQQRPKGRQEEKPCREGQWFTGRSSRGHQKARRFTFGGIGPGSEEEGATAGPLPCLAPPERSDAEALETVGGEKAARVVAVPSLADGAASRAGFNWAAVSVAEPSVTREDSAAKAGGLTVEPCLESAPIDLGDATPSLCMERRLDPALMGRPSFRRPSSEFFNREIRLRFLVTSNPPE